MNILIACEESQTVCNEFRKRGHQAFSCDIQDCSGGHPEYHIKNDILKVLQTPCIFKTMNGRYYYIEKWDMIIAFPPCTYLTVTGNRWFNEQKYGEKAIERKARRNAAIKFFEVFVNSNVEKIAIENPVGIMNTLYRKPDQIIHPYYFALNGDDLFNNYEKRTCLWLKGLPKLTYDIKCEPPARYKAKSGKTMPKWYAELLNEKPEERAKIISKTSPGLAKAMAEQWG